MISSQLYANMNFLAAMYSREDTVQWLLAKKSHPNSCGGPMNQTVLHLASARQSGQSVQIVKILLLHCSKDLRLKEDSCGSIPLFCAIEAGNNNVCRELLSVNPEQQVRVSITDPPSYNEIYKR